MSEQTHNTNESTDAQTPEVTTTTSVPVPESAHTPDVKDVDAAEYPVSGGNEDQDDDTPVEPEDDTNGS